MRSYFPTLLGNDLLSRRIGSAIDSRTLSHAYILEGADGCGKRTLATLIAAALACEGSKDGPLPCGQCAHCSRILSGASPDVRIIEPTGTTISVDAIREARSDMYLSSTEEETKVYIIDHADAMTPQAQNALLIVLEEPPTNLLILLLTDRADALLPTIRSRAACLRMSLLTRENIISALEGNRDAEALRRRDPDAFEALVENAAGCLGNVLDMLDGKKGAELMKMRAAVSSAVHGMICADTYTKRLEQMQELPTKRAELMPYLNMMTTALRDLIVLAGDEQATLCYYTNREDAVALSESTDTAKLVSLFDAVTDAANAINMNANVNLTLLTLFTRIK